ncbi:MAG: hypothetical protein JOY90_23330 [Bradyrhizobium sp.]|nr:hypothetical protein [Bradyrhizobium sp.]
MGDYQSTSTSFGCPTKDDPCDGIEWIDPAEGLPATEAKADVRLRLDQRMRPALEVKLLHQARKEIAASWNGLRISFVTQPPSLPSSFINKGSPYWSCTGNLPS